jgi:hypothetical protein
MRKHGASPAPAISLVLADSSGLRMFPTDRLPQSFSDQDIAVVPDAR